MISRLKGVLLTRDPESVEVETPGGVVYEVEVPLTVLERLPDPGAQVELRTVQVVTDASVALYGFVDDLERTLFRRLLTASGVGGKLALAMMSTYRADRLARALVEKDLAALGRAGVPWGLAREIVDHEDVDLLQEELDTNRY